MACASVLLPLSRPSQCRETPSADQAADGRTAGARPAGARVTGRGCGSQWRTGRRFAAWPQAPSPRQRHGARHRICGAHGSSKPPRPAVRRWAWPLGLVEFAEAGEAVRVQEASAGTEQRLGMHSPAVRRVTIDRGGRYARSPGALVAHHHPEPPGSGSAQAGGKHGDGGVISMRDGAGEVSAPGEFSPNRAAEEPTLRYAGDALTVV